MLVFLANCAVFKVRREARGGTWPPPGLSKLNSMPTRLPGCGGTSPNSKLGRRFGTAHKVNRTLGTPCLRVWAKAGCSLGLPRKEVIQPHLPVRLPCYDFTPIAGPTFDGSLPCGLGHRLRALPIPVV